MVISDIQTLEKSITVVTFVEQVAHREDKERWAICMTIDSLEGRNDIFIGYKMPSRAESETRMWRSVDAAYKAVESAFTKHPIYVIKPLEKKQ